MLCVNYISTKLKEKIIKVRHTDYRKFGKFRKVKKKPVSAMFPDDIYFVYIFVISVNIG